MEKYVDYIGTADLINDQMMAEMDDEVYVDVIAVVALTVGALNHFDEVIAAAINCLRGWNDLREKH